MAREAIDIDEEKKIFAEWFREDRYSTPNLNVSAVSMTVEEKKMSRRSQ
jgi:hypothetical protein